MEAKVIKASDVLKCPKLSLAVSHYRADGSCKCDALGRLEQEGGPDEAR